MPALNPLLAYSFYPLLLTRHEGEAGRQLHEAPRGDGATARTLQHSPVGTADSAGADTSRHWSQVVGDGEGGATADLHSGRGAGCCLDGGGGTWQVGDCECRFQCVLHPE